MTNEIHPAQSELTNSSPSPKLEVRNIYMPDPNSESSSTTPVLERPHAASRPKSSAKEAVRRFRETGERPARIEGNAPRSASSSDIKEDVKRAASRIDPDRFDDSQIKAMANAIKRGEMLSHGTLQDFRDIAKARVSADVNVDPEEATVFTQFVDDLIHVVDVSEGTGRTRELPEEAQVKYYRNEYIKKILKQKQELDREAAGGTITPDQKIEKADLEKIIEDFPTQQEKRLLKLVAELPLQEGSLEKSTIALIAESGKALDYLVNRLLSIPLDYELGEYSLGFYGQNNLEAVKSYLKAASESTRGDVGREYRRAYDKLLVESSAIAFFHSMNKLIVMGNLDGFTRGAEQITPEQLQLMQGVLGSSLVMRLLDQEYELLLSRDGWINNDNYGKMMGFEIKDDPDPETGEAKGRIVDSTNKGSVSEKFKLMVEEARNAKASALDLVKNAELRGDQAEADRFKDQHKDVLTNRLADMADWEVGWAYNVGKILHNLSLRPAEYISQGRNPPGAEQYASFPQEGMARLMNWMNEMMLRFDVAPIRGGVWLTNKVKEKYEAQRETDGYQKVKISEIQGKELSWFELPGVFDVSGPMSSWRQTLMILRQIPFDETVLARLNVSKVIRPEGEALSLGHLVDTKLIKFTEKGKEIGFDDLSDKLKANYFRTVFLDGNDLRTDIDTALGVLLKNGSLAPDSDPEKRHKYKEFDDVKQEIRQAIWRRVAEDNPLAIAPYLNGLKYKGEKDAIKIIGKGGKAEQLGVNYEEFSQKLFRLNEIRMQRLRREKTYDNPEKGYISLQALIREQIAGGKLEWNVVEQQLLDYIKEQGVRAAPEFANIRFNFNPFMNDVLFENIKYAGAGAEFYRRRAAGDLGSMFKALQGFIALAGNPGSYEVEKYLEHIHAIVEGLGSPLGTEAGQRKALPVYEAMQEFTARGENNFEHIHVGPLKIDLEHEHKTLGKTVNHRVVKTLRKWAPVHALLNSSNRPNSWAQQYTGSMTAHAFNTSQQDKVLHEAAHMGTLNHEQVKKLRKKLFGMFRFKFLFWLLADFFPLFAIGTGVDITKKPFTEGDVFK